jgi:phosphatidylglycerol---prolipoprotein diacylglyceryl transferase
MLTYPDINPVALQIGALKIHWYGLMYLLGLVSAWFLANYRVKWYALDWEADEIHDLVFYAGLGVILGGRVGYLLFYDFSTWLSDPLRLVRFWDGGIAGMSFHGGLIGVIIAVLIYAWRYNRCVWETLDFIAPLVPIGLAAGRIGNFINGELWGRPTTVSWGMVFPHVDELARHPSQLYEFALEGVVLFIILWVYSRRPRPRMAVSSLFALSYGAFRFFIEFFREPDVQLGFLAWGWLTMGQLLTVPMITIGIIGLSWAYHRDRFRSAHV